MPFRWAPEMEEMKEILKGSRAVPFALNNNTAERSKDIISNLIIGCSALMPLQKGARKIMLLLSSLRRKVQAMKYYFPDGEEICD